MSYPVKVYKSTDTGAPALSGTAGALIGVLDSILNGYNLKTVTITRAGATATVTDNGHGRNTGDIVLIAGADPAEYNGEAKITVADSNTYTYPVSGSPSTPATGTITAKMAPMAGWSKAFSDTNKAAYQSTALGATGLYLRVDDTAAQSAILRGYESMTSVDTGSAPFPTTAQLAGGIIPRKSDASSAAARPWIIVCDDRLIYLFNAWTATATPTGQYEAGWFGDPISFKAGDAYHAMLVGNPSLPSSLGNVSNSLYLNATIQSGHYMARAYSQLGSAIPFSKNGLYRPSPYLGSLTGGLYPNRPDNALHVRGPIDLYDGASIADLRGILPGVYDTPQNAQASLSSGDIVTDIVGLDRQLLVIKSLASGNVGMWLMDIKGPWR